MKKLFIEIHRALHSNAKRVNINGKSVAVDVNDQKLRCVYFEDEGKKWEMVQQNPNTVSRFGERARNGEKISWLIPIYFGTTRLQNGWQAIDDKTEVI